MILFETSAIYPICLQSVSSEDDTEKINELLRNPKKAKSKNQGLWWLEDDEKKKGKFTLVLAFRVDGK